MDFHVTNLTSDRFEDYLDFTRRIFPQRGHVATRFEVQLLENPYLADPDRLEVLLACDDTGMIVGQTAITPYRFHNGGEESLGFSGFDYYVLEDYRKHGIGKMMAVEVIRRVPFFAMGGTPLTERIYLKLGVTIVGHMYRYFWFRSPLQTGYLMGHAVLKDRWYRAPEQVGDFDLPDQISIGDVIFDNRTNAEGWKDYAWSDEMLSFSRPSEFLEWRYFNHPEHYRLYSLRGSNPTAYFVLRRYHWRGLSLLCMVDFRMPEGDIRSLERMLNAAKSLAKVGKFDGVVVYSSIHSVDECLGTQGFRRIGQPTSAFIKGDLAVDETRIAERNYILMNLADCDHDFVIYD